MSEEEKKELEELKSLLYRDSITQYGKRHLINLYENLIETQNKMIELMAEYIDGYQIECYQYFKDKNEVIELFRNKAKESE